MDDPESTALKVKPQAMPDVKAAQEYALELIKAHKLDLRIWDYYYSEKENQAKSKKGSKRKATKPVNKMDFSFRQGSLFLKLTCSSSTMAFEAYYFCHESILNEHHL